MGTIAFVCSGQGDQYVGMGQTLCKVSPAARSVFDEAEALRPGTISQCHTGDEAVLRQTINTQPCLYTMEMAAAAFLHEHGIKPDMTAGFSLGELAALTLGKAADFHAMFPLVCKRASLMQTASDEHPASMAAVLRLSMETVLKLCAQYEHVYPVNFNAPGQVTVSGDEEELKNLQSAVKALGGRCIPVKVSGGFHSPYMQKASEAFADVLSQVTLFPTSIQVYSNKTSEPYPADPEAMKKLLSAQMASPVRWEDTVRHMIRDGAEMFIEIGPGQTLTHMIRRIDTGVKAVHLAEPSDLEVIQRAA